MRKNQARQSIAPTDVSAKWACPVSGGQVSHPPYPRNLARTAATTARADLPEIQRGSARRYPLGIGAERLEMSADARIAVSGGDVVLHVHVVDKPCLSGSARPFSAT